MKFINKILLLSVICLCSSFLNVGLADESTVNFTIKVLPKQQKVDVIIDNASQSGITLKSEFVKLNTITNNYHIKVTIINGSGQVLYHQLALIEHIKGSEIKYPDGTTDYQDNKGIPYYNYGNIKENKMAVKEWYLSNTGKEEIEIKGYVVNKEIPIILGEQIPRSDPALIATLIKYYAGLRDNDLDIVLSTIPRYINGGSVFLGYTDDYSYPYALFPWRLQYVLNPYEVVVLGEICYIHYKWFSPRDGVWHEGGLELQKDPFNKWWITR